MKRISQIIILFFSILGLSGCLNEYNVIEPEREEDVRSIFISDNRLYILGETLDLQSGKNTQFDIQNIQKLFNDYGKYVKEIGGYIKIKNLGSGSPGAPAYIYFQASWDLSGLTTKQKLDLAKLLLPEYHSPSRWTEMEEMILSGKKLPPMGMGRHIPLAITKIQNRDFLIEKYPLMTTYFSNFTKIYIDRQTEHSKFKHTLNNAMMIILSPALVAYCVIGEGGCIPKG